MATGGVVGRQGRRNQKCLLSLTKRPLGQQKSPSMEVRARIVRMLKANSFKTSQRSIGLVAGLVTQGQQRNQIRIIGVTSQKRETIVLRTGHITHGQCLLNLL